MLFYCVLMLLKKIINFGKKNAFNRANPSKSQSSSYATGGDDFFVYKVYAHMIKISSYRLLFCSLKTLSRPAIRTSLYARMHATSAVSFNSKILICTFQINLSSTKMFYHRLRQYGKIRLTNQIQKGVYNL